MFLTFITGDYKMNFKYVWYKAMTKIKGVAITDSKVAKDAKIEANSVFVSSNIGRFSYCGYGCYIVNTEIGAFCSISDNVSIGGGTHPLNWVSTSPAFYHGKDSISKRLANLEYNMKDPHTIIENDVWIGKGVYIKPGVTISNGAVIGMGSVVTKDVNAYAIVAGNPAREIGKRFDDSTIEKMLQTEWWMWDENILKKKSHLFDNVNGFLNEAVLKHQKL